MTGTAGLAGHLLAGGLDGRRVPVAVVGGGQAGLSVSRLLTARGVEHVVLERHRVGWEWAERRWDSFCLVTPNYQCQLPGHAYPGAAPDGFMVKQEIVGYLRAYVASFRPPLHEGVEVTELRETDRAGGRDGAGADGREHPGFELVTTRGTLQAAQVVIATGPYQRPCVPRVAERLPAGIVQLHSSGYRNPGQLPDGSVLVVGTGQSGCQISEDLHRAGRRVHLATGSAPRVARTYRGRDCMTWLDEIGHYAKGLDQFPDAGRLRWDKVNHYVTGRDGGHDIDLRAFAREGMVLHGRLLDVDRATGSGTDTVTFADDLARNLDSADAVAESIKDLIDTHIAERGIDAPPQARYSPVWQPPAGATELKAGDVAGVVWCTGFERDFRWVEVPVFDGRGQPVHHRGVTDRPGLYMIGLPWQWTWGSGRFLGVGRDAEYVVERIVRRSVRPVAA